VARRPAVPGIFSVGLRRLVVLACVVALLPHAPASATGRRKGRVAKRTAKTRPEPAAPRTEHGTRGIDEEHLHVRLGDSLGGLLAARGVGATEAREWLAAAHDVYDLRQLHPRQGLTLRFDRATHALEGIRYEIDDRSMLIVDQTADGPQARRAVLPYFMEVKGLAGRIDRGLREDATGSGVPESVVSELADIFGWELDVANDLRAGDEFRVLYENIWQAGEQRPEAGKVLGAEITSHGRQITAVLFEDADGRGSYYEPSGTPLSRDFLRYPLEFTEISSDFSLERRHPILRVTRPHLGVDFAAPVGTPVRAVASGIVAAAGWVNQLGRAIRLDHSASLESVYGHLSRIAPGVHEGSPVERGQVIGYVGATGLATGPHLHFGLFRDGEYVDPLALTATPAEPIPVAARRRFERVRAAVTHQLAVLPKSEQPLTVSLSTVATRPE
jgi:murein DD-endopeptidase MepM/ murein hydrolase activator NlpD